MTLRRQRLRSSSARRVMRQGVLASGILATRHPSVLRIVDSMKPSGILVEGSANPATILTISDARVISIRCSVETAHLKSLEGIARMCSPMRHRNLSKNKRNPRGSAMSLSMLHTHPCRLIRRRLLHAPPVERREIFHLFMPWSKISTRMSVGFLRFSMRRDRGRIRWLFL